MQYLEKMVPQQNTTAQAMQISAKMESHYSCTQNCGVSKILCNWYFEST